MSKGLEAWERIKEGIDTNVWKCGYWDDIDTIEKELQALEIIKEKKVNCLYIVVCKNVEEYNNIVPIEKDELTKKQFSLLKGVLL